MFIVRIFTGWGGYEGEELTWGAKILSAARSIILADPWLYCTAACLVWKLSIRFSFLAFPRKTAYS